MNFLTLPEIKAHSRIDFDIEDALLELYADAAEGAVLEITGYSLDELKAKYGAVPPQIKQAAMMLVDVSYTHRSPVNPTQAHAVGYTFDMLVKPFMKLTHPQS